ncbi:MAG: RidA family protein [Haloplanus sp.]
MTREEISTDDAPESIGPFSQAIRHDDTVYVSGQGPVDPETGEIVGDDIKEQTARTLENIEVVLEAADTSLANVLKTTVFVTDMDDYDDVNEVYAEYMSDPFPARSAVEVADLPVDIGVEIEVIATVQS